ncbi:MAG: TIGR02996 domain-containing protein [Polyangiaceae bacterium]
MDDAQFLDLLAKNPGDLETRRVYADWLEARSDPRAEYLRLELRRAELTRTIDARWLHDVRLRSPGGPRFFVRGASVTLMELNVIGTYEGLLEGLPTRERNARRLAALRAEKDALGWARYVIEPEETPIDHPRYPFGNPASLPAYQCVGRLQGMAVGDGDAASLTVVWFQDEMPTPIAAPVVEELARLDWAAHAHDFVW